MEELAEAIRNEGKPKKQPTFTEMVDARIQREIQ
jgi:hypothetical protein